MYWYPYLCLFQNMVMSVHRKQVLIISLIQPCIFSVKIYTCTIYEMKRKLLHVPHLNVIDFQAKFQALTTTVIHETADM